MMQFFDLLHKVNFVDDRNCFAGYDMQQCCCEYYVYRILDGDKNVLFDSGENIDVDKLNEHLKAFRFDATAEPVPVDDEKADECQVHFKLISDTGETGWLVFSNCHNGYYSHLWDYGHDKEVKESGYI